MDSSFIYNPFYQYIAFVVLALVPMVRIFERMGRKPWWVVVMAVPYIGFVLCLAVLAFRKEKRV